MLLKPCPPPNLVWEELSFMKPVPGAKKIGVRWCRTKGCQRLCSSWDLQKQERPMENCLPTSNTRGSPSLTDPACWLFPLRWVYWGDTFKFPQASMPSTVPDFYWFSVSVKWMNKWLGLYSISTSECENSLHIKETMIGMTFIEYLPLVSGVDGIPAELFTVLKDDAIKVLHLICRKI